MGKCTLPLTLMLPDKPQSLCRFARSFTAPRSSNQNPQVRNLEERIKIDELKEALMEIFSEYGNIVDLVAKKNLKAKGQAFIVFEDKESAERAVKEVQGFELFEKPMLLDYAKTKSDATVQREGSAEEFDQHKRRRLAEKGISLTNPVINSVDADSFIDLSRT